MLKQEFQREKFKLNHNRPADFTMCFWQKKPKVLPIWITYRLLLTVYYFCIFSAIALLKPNEDWYKQLLYIASWTVILQLLVFLVAFLITVARFLKEKKDPELPPLELMPWHYKALWFLYNMTASSSFLVTCTFWFYVYDPEVHTNLFYDITFRTLNSFFMLLDVILYAIPIRFLHFYIPMILALLFFLFTCIYQYSGGTGIGGKILIYTILDWRQPVRVLSTFALSVICSFVVHSGLFGLYLAKRWLKKSREEEEEE